MNELYWITRLDLINGWFVAFSVISGILLILSFAICFIAKIFLATDDESYPKEQNQKIYNGWKPVRKTSFIVFALFLLLSILTPTKNEAFMIWGVGGTIDYIKSNDKIQQLPDKCVDALDAWVESLNIEKKEETK